MIACAAVIAALALGCVERPREFDDEGRLIVTINNGPIPGDETRIHEDKMTREQFEGMNPGLTWRADPWQFSPETFLARIAGNTATDIVGITDATAGMGLAERGLAMDLTPLLEEWEHFDELNPVILGTYMNEHGVFGLPAQPGYSMCLGFNKRMFIEAGLVDENGEPNPPDTWDELVECALALTNHERGVAGFAVLGKDDQASWHFLNWAYQAGGDFERRDEHGDWKAVYDEPEVVTALQFLYDLRWKHDVLPHSAFMANDEQMRMIAADRLAMFVFVPEFLDYMARVYSYPIENIGIAMLPAGPEGHACVMGGAFNIINPQIKDPERIEAAFRVMTHMITPERWEVRCRLLREQGRPVGYPAVSFWRGEMRERWEEIEDAYRNVPPEPEYVALASEHARYEPPIRCKQLYTELYPIIQAVLTDRDANCAQLLADSARRFERRHLR